MARSASRVASALAAAVALAGCVSTQTKNARTLLINQRTLDGESPLRVTRTDPAVQVTALQAIRSSAGAALIVTLHNRTDHPLSDLPISVGVVGRGGRAEFLNGAANLTYFDSHVPSIAARAAAIWVLTTRRAIPRGTPFARIGFPHRPSSTTVAALPRIDVASAATGARLRVTVSNLSGVPQYGLQLYAVGMRAGRYVAAGRASLGRLDSGGSARIALSLIGSPSGARFQLAAPATIFK